MNLLMFLLVLAVVAAVTAIVLGRMPGGMPEPSSTVPQVRLPGGEITGEDVNRLRFVPGLRGYRMDQVDEAMDRLAEEVDRLRALVPPEVLAAADDDVRANVEVPASAPFAAPRNDDPRDDTRTSAFSGVSPMPEILDAQPARSAPDGDR